MAKKRKRQARPTFQRELGRIMSLIYEASCSLGLMRDAMEEDTPVGQWLEKKGTEKQKEAVYSFDSELDAVIGHMEDVLYGHLEVPKCLQKKLL